MNKTNHAGIDYSGPGSSVNRDGDTRIRYGIIPSNSINPDALEDIYQNGEDLDWLSVVAEIKAQIARLENESELASFLKENFSNRCNPALWAESLMEQLSSESQAMQSHEANATIWNEIEQTFADYYEPSGDCTRYSYESDGYKLQTDSDGDLWVFKSNYFTYAQFCSPCAPGACYLKSPLDSPVEANKCYCLGLDWFDNDNPCPYPVYSVETGELVTV